MPDQNRKPHDKAIARLNRLAGLAFLAMWSERIWRRIWPPFGIALLFLSVSWLGLWRYLPPLGHDALLLLFAFAFLYSFKGFLSLHRPSVQDALRRIDRDSALPHGEAETMNDRLVIGREDPATRALWLLHRKRAADAIGGMRVNPPNPDMPRHDPYALRAILILVALASAFIAGPERGERVSSAFRLPIWFGGETTHTAIASGWIDPPAYTGLPPQVLTFNGSEQQVRAPIGSTLVLRGGGENELRMEAQPALTEISPPAADNKAAQRSYKLDKDSSITLKSGWFGSTTLKISLIPDQPPTIALNGDITANQRGSFVVPYKAEDDYGVTEVKAVFSLAPGVSSLVPAPEISLQAPRGKGVQEMRQTIDLSDHPWAGMPVTLTLVAKDAAGNEGRSAPFNMVLPQRPLTAPLAKALAEQRRNLVIDPNGRAMAKAALEGFLAAPERFSTDAGIYLGLNHGHNLLRKIRTADDQVAVADYLWAMAVQIEDGTLSDAERDLRAAQEKLQEAISKGASPEEIDRLAQEMREAMNRYMQELAQRMAKNSEQKPLMGDNSQTMTPDQLSKMLDQFEKLMRQGRTAEAQALLDQMRSIFDNMRTGNGEMDPTTRQMMEAMGEANSLLNDQQKLMDETHERNRKGQIYKDEPQKDSDLNALKPRQEELRKRLEELQQKGKELGMEQEPNLGEAEQAMREAEQALGQQDGSKSTEAQGRAVEALSKGAQGMMQQAQQMLGNMPMAGNGSDQRGPHNPYQGKANTRDVRERIEELIEELRNKLSDPARPKDELDYFERLLRQ